MFTMHFYYKQLPNGRWGIYEGSALLATIGCRQECILLVQTLNQRALKSLKTAESTAA